MGGESSHPTSAMVFSPIRLMKPPVKIKVSILSATLLLIVVTLCRGLDEEARKHWLHELGGSFFISRDQVQADLKLTDDQKRKLDPKLTADVQEVQQVQSLPPTQRPQALQSLRQKLSSDLDVSLNEILTPSQLKRFQQLKLQYDMPGIMLQPTIGKALEITEDQRKQFQGLIQTMQTSVLPLIREAKSGGNPQQILPKVIQLRLDCQAKIEALLSSSQRQQWKEMVGSPLVIW